MLGPLEESGATVGAGVVCSSWCSHGERCCGERECIFSNLSPKTSRDDRLPEKKRYTNVTLFTISKDRRMVKNSKSNRRIENVSRTLFQGENPYWLIQLWRKKKRVCPSDALAQPVVIATIQQPFSTAVQLHDPTTNVNHVRPSHCPPGQPGCLHPVRRRNDVLPVRDDAGLQ